MTEALAVKEWYSYSKYYDFEKGTIKYPAEAKSKEVVKREAESLTGLLWRSYSRASFAVRAPWVVGRFCPAAGASISSTRTPVDNVENVNPLCSLPTSSEDGGYNRCYNKLALRYHNGARALREGTKNLVLDPAISKYLQGEMGKAEFSTTGKVKRSGRWADCGESVYTRDEAASSSSPAVEFTNEASQAWYAGVAAYNADTGKANDVNDGSAVAKMKSFA
jgi:hypothetical protein